MIYWNWKSLCNVIYNVKLLLQNSDSTTWHTKYYALSHEAKKAYENMDEKCPKDEHGGRDRESRTY